MKQVIQFLEEDEDNLLIVSWNALAFGVVCTPKEYSTINQTNIRKNINKG